jgi:hypothetical protein
MDEKIKPRGRGRPVKKVARGQKRVQISMIVSAELKTRIDAKAKREGRTFSQIGEMMLERADVVDGLLKTLNRPLEDIVQEALEVEMLRRGYKKLRMRDAPRGFAWVSPELLSKKPKDESESPAEFSFDDGRAPLGNETLKPSDAEKAAAEASISPRKTGGGRRG